MNEKLGGMSLIRLFTTGYPGKVYSKKIPREKNSEVLWGKGFIVGGKPLRTSALGIFGGKPCGEMVSASGETPCGVGETPGGVFEGIKNRVLETKPGGEKSPRERGDIRYIFENREHYKNSRGGLYTRGAKIFFPPGKKTLPAS